MDLLDWLPWVIVPIFAVLAVRGYLRQNELVKEWAAANNVILVRRLASWYRLSPFPLAAALGKHRIQYWLVRDAVGMEHRVWLKLGDFILGSLVEKVEDQWES